MTKKELVEALEPYPDDIEVCIQELACENVRPSSSVSRGWYVDDEENAPSFISDEENPEDYDIDPNQEKILVIE